DERTGDSKLIAGSLDGAAQHQGRSRRPGDALEVLFSGRKFVRRARCDDLQPGHAREPRAHRLRERVAEKLAVRLAAQVLERKDREKPGRGTGCGRRGGATLRPDDRERGDEGGGDGRDRDCRRPLSGNPTSARSRWRDRKRTPPERLQRLVDLDPRVSDVPEPVVRVLLKRATEQVADPRGSLGRERVPCRLGGQDRGQDVGRRLPRENATAGQELVKDTTERPDVGPL